MVSARYLFDVAEWFCTNAMPRALVTSVNSTPGETAPAVTSHKALEAAAQPAARRPLRMALPELPTADDPFRLLDDEEVIGRQVAERLLDAGRPGDLDGVHRCRTAQPEVEPEVVLRVVARSARHLVDLAA